MFGFGGKTHDVRLTDEELDQLKNNMSKSERKAFERRQRQAEGDRMWDAMIFSELFENDDE